MSEGFMKNVGPYIYTSIYKYKYINTYKYNRK